MAEDVAQRRALPLLARPRLTTRLDGGTGRRLTVVTGPPGSGKSVLLDEWLTDHTGQSSPRRHFGHVRLDERDRDPDRLWRRVLASVGGVDRPAGADPVVVADRLDRVPGQVVLVLDGLDALHDGPAARSVATLLGFGLRRLRLVVGTRRTSTLPVDRLRLAGELTEIGAADLAFTGAEVRQLWRGQGRALDDVGALLAWTEGWAAAVGLAVMAAGSAQDESREQLHRFVQTEIVDQLDPSLREFLTRVSIVADVTPDLARALVGGGPHPFDEAVRDGHLRPSGLGWHRCPGPVRATLRRAADQRLADELPDLHRRAAEWFAGHDRPVTALHHAGEAGDWARTAALVLRLAAPLLLGPDRGQLASATARLPIVDALGSPELAVALAVGAAARGDGTGSPAYAALAEPHLDALPPSRRVPLQALLLLSALVPARLDEDVVALAGPATALLDLLDAAAPGLVPHAEQHRAAALEALGTARLWSGDHGEAGRLLTAAVRTADAAGLAGPATEARAGLAMLHCGRGQLREALALAELAGDRPPGLARLVLATGHWLAGRRESASHCLAATDQPGPTGRLARRAVAALRARLLAETDLAGAREVLIGLSTPDIPGLLRGWLALAEADLHLIEARPVQGLAVLGDAGYGPDAPLGAATRVMAARAYLANAAPARALSLLAPLAGWPDVGPGIMVEAHLVEALAADALGHDGAVTIALGAAIAAAAPDRIVAPFHVGVLRALLARHTDLFDPVFVARLALAPTPAVALVEPITTRERVVLRYLPTMLTLTDIARELSVSPNTVKTHLRHLYRKLAVSSRRDAVRQARRRGLLADPGATGGQDVAGRALTE
jgi:LuxR family maltose regulon positive regulatory protein